MRWSVAVESPAGLSAGAAIASAGGAQISADGPYPGFAIYKIVVGGRGTSTSQQVSVAVSAPESPGSPETYTWVQALDPMAAVVQQGSMAGGYVGYAAGSFSTDPAAAPLYEVSFNTMGGSAVVDLQEAPLVIPYVSGGSYHTSQSVVALTNVGAAVPDDYLFTVTFEVGILV